MSTDYLVLGGSLAAQVLVARLREYEPSVTITLIVPDTAHVGTPSSQCGCKQASHGSGSDRSSSDSICAASVVQLSMLPLTTSPQSLNWRRSGADDYNKWAELVQDPRWSYDSLQIYFQRVESELAKNGNGNGRAREQSPHAQMSDLVRQVLLADMQKAEEYEKRHDVADGLYREPYRYKPLLAPTSYPLRGIEVINSHVQRLLFSRKIARGVELDDGRRIIARREVIIATGAIESAHHLLLSGVGPADELASMGIECLINAPVGQNLHGQSAFLQRYEMLNRNSNADRDAESLYMLGSPVGDMITASVKRDSIQRALRAEGRSGSEATGDSHVGICPLREPLCSSDSSPTLKQILAVATVNITPHSRGVVELASADPTDGPLVTCNALSSAIDRTIFHKGIRLATRMFDSPLARKTFRPLQPDDALSSTSPPAEIDEVLQQTNLLSISSGGTAAMGLVVDNNLKVIGTERLRVVDESVIPLPIAADYRAAACVIAEQAAVLIALAWNQTDDCAPV